MFSASNATNSTINQSSSTRNTVSPLEIIAVILTALPTIIGNNLIVFTFFKNYKMRTVTNNFVINMCIADVMSVVADIFFLLVQLVYKDLFHQPVFCRISIFLNRFLMNVVVVSMVAISVDRYINLVQNSLRRPTRKHLVVILSYVWLHGFVTSLPWDLFFSTVYSDVALEVCKRFPQPYLDPTAMTTLSYITKTVTVLLPYAGIIWVFAQVAMSARRRRSIQVQDTVLVNPQAARKTERFALHSYGRATVSAFLIFSSFIGLTLPFLGTVAWAMVTQKTIFSPSIDMMVFFLFRLQGALLPVLYLLRNRFIFDFLSRRCFCFRSTDRIREKRSIKRTKQTNRYKIFYTARVQKELSLAFTDITTVKFEEFTTQTKNDSKVIIVKEESTADTDSPSDRFNDNVYAVHTEPIRSGITLQKTHINKFLEK
ncbi:probable G-protein coupled receptor 83 isoform X1 [Exaiptasia diaphana]|uniref:G-protein coupled receptors family 1 profile domain-containing protein n=1 Tax=Exaiptasia diaphana TaxID=2652724 RepID=A0A913XCI6_EXADI|nr:probable G-protein coupled receptor 83 isoform X1 [Exaiptasia diaphana]